MGTEARIPHLPNPHCLYKPFKGSIRTKHSFVAFFGAHIVSLVDIDVLHSKTF